MKAIRIHDYGDASALKYEDAPVPEPTPDGVLIKVHAAGVNPVDWKIRKGLMRAARPLPFPAVLGGDIAGTVTPVASPPRWFTSRARIGPAGRGQVTSRACSRRRATGIFPGPTPTDLRVGPRPDLRSSASPRLQTSDERARAQARGRARPGPGRRVSRVRAPSGGVRVIPISTVYRFGP